MQDGGGIALPTDRENLPLGGSAEPILPSSPDDGPVLKNGPWVLNTVTALGAVLGLILLLRAAMTRWAGQTAMAGNATVELLSRSQLAPRHQISLVRVGQRILVVGESGSGLRTLADIDDPEEVAALLTSIASTQDQSATRRFASLLSRFNGNYSEYDPQSLGGDDGEVHVDRARDQVTGLLTRVRSIAKGGTVA